MTNWYGVEDPTRLMAAWPGAPIENTELCGFILEVARDQVIAYAPASTSEVVPLDPVELTLTDGATVLLTREGDMVTAYLTSEGDDTGTVEIPEQFGGGIFSYDGSGDVLPRVYRWVVDLPVDPGVPSRYVYAQLQQAKNLWAAGRADENGDVGTEGYSFVPRPLDKTIRNIIRPVQGMIHAL